MTLWPARMLVLLVRGYQLFQPDARPAPPFRPCLLAPRRRILANARGRHGELVGTAARAALPSAASRRACRRANRPTHNIPA